jgi:hypothetical protein
MTEKFAFPSREVQSEFIGLSHTKNLLMLVSLVIPKFAPGPSCAFRRTLESGHQAWTF